MKHFHSLTICAQTPEGSDAVRIPLDVPEELRDEYRFLPGQHLPIQFECDGKTLRRTYSICSPAGQWPLEIGVRVQRLNTSRSVRFATSSRPRDSTGSSPYSA